MLLFRFGGDLLSHVLRRSTIGVLALNCRVRDGIGCFTSTMTTKPKKEHGGFSGPPKHQYWCNHCAIALFVPSLEYCAFDCRYFSDDPEALPNIVRDALLFLDQIKPIEQLVPVS